MAKQGVELASGVVLTVPRGWTIAGGKLVDVEVDDEGCPVGCGHYYVGPNGEPREEPPPYDDCDCEDCRMLREQKEV